MRLMVWFPRDADRADQRRVWELRGGPLFTALNVMGHVLPGVDLRVYQASGDGVPIFDGPLSRPGDVLYADLSLLIDNPQLADTAFTMGCSVIVDLHFPLDRTENILSVQEILDGHDRDSEKNQEARALWRGPVRRQAAFSILRQADVITSGPVGSAIGIKTVPLPDLETEADVAVFYRRFARLLIKMQPGGPWLKRWRRVLCGLPLRLYSQNVVSQVELPVKEA